MAVVIVAITVQLLSWVKFTFWFGPLSVVLYLPYYCNNSRRGNALSRTLEVGERRSLVSMAL